MAIKTERPTLGIKKERPMLDPIAYREDYPEEAIIWWKANESFNQFWDDSDLAHQQQSLGWLSEKYEWEGTFNYNKDANIKDLPSYVYGRDTSKQPNWYITQRNDNIASALYNEWVTSKDAIVSYLASQEWWNNSSEMDRINTVEAIWKRMWQLGETPKEEEKKEEVDTSKMESDLNKSSNDVIYWKTTADSGNPEEWIKTNNDVNLAYDIDAQARVAAVRSLLTMDTDAIATSIWIWDTPVDWQAITDYQTWYPQLWAEVKTKLNQLKWQNAVNDITNGSTDYVTADVESKEKQTENDKKAKAESVASSTEEASDIISDLNNDLANNPSATTAEDTMAKLTDDMNKLKTRLKNLRKEANSVFKWDVPDYIVNAYINNRTQEINDRLKELQYDYDAAYKRNRDAIDDAWKWREYWLKQDQLELQKQQQWFNEWYQKQTLAKSTIEKDDNWTYWKLNMAEDGTIYYTKVDKIQSYSDSWMTGKWLKNNNPWNIKDDSFWNVIWHDDSWFAIFATPEDWFDALVKKIIYNQTNPNSKYYGTTIREYFKMYAPLEDGNNPNSYAQQVARALWVSVDTPISKLDPVEFAKVIAKHDSWYNYDTYWQFRGNNDISDNGWTTFTDRDYKNFEKFMNPDTSASDKKVIAQQYWYGDDLKWMTNFANNALDKKAAKQDFDVNSIEVPSSIYDDWYRNIDPNSEEWKRLRQEYIDNYIKENGLWWSSNDDSNWAMKTVRLKSWEEYKMPMDFYRYIYNPIPSRQKDSDEDKRWIIEDILELYNQWLSASDAFLVYNGVDLNSDYADTASTLIKYLMGAWKEIDEWIYSSLVYNLSKWNIWQAISNVENFVIPDDMKDDLVYITALTEKISDFIELTSNPEYTKYFWPYDSPINKEIWERFWNAEAMKAYADLWNIYADIRQALMGNAMTEHEAEIYAPILAETDENLNTVIQKLNSTLQKQLATYNAIRWQFWLPRLNLYDDDLVDMVLYPIARARLYEDDNNY